MEIPILATATLVLIGLERLPSTRLLPIPFARANSRTDAFCLATGALALGFLMRGEAARWMGTPSGVPSGAGPTSALYGLAIAVYDATSWATHILLHRSARLWDLHKVHHSSPRLDWLATYRAHLLEHGLRHLASPVAMILLGFPFETVVIAAAVYGAFASLGHANVRLPLHALEGVFITPRLHRIHHVPATTENNFGTIFSVWDRAYGSLWRAPEVPRSRLGVPGEVESYPQTWLELQRQPFR